MKILFINMTPFYGGGEVYLKNLISKFILNDEELFLVSPKVEKLFEDINIKKSNIFLSDTRYFNFFNISKTINKIIEENNIDCVFFNGNKSIYLSPFIDKGVAKVCTRHMLTTSNKGIKKYISNKLAKFCFKFIDKVIVISKFHKDDLLNKKLCEKSKVEIVYNGIDTKLFVRNQLNKKSSDVLKITQIARLEKHKGQIDLIEVFKDIVKDHKKCELVFVGEGNNKEEMEKLICKYNLVDKVKLIGFTDDVKSILNETDIFVLPSYDEGLPLSILEAMSMELPIISTRIAGIPEIVGEDNNGFIIEPGDLKQLFIKINILLKDDSLRKKFGENSRNIVTNGFDLENMYLGTKKVIELALKNK